MQIKLRKASLYILAVILVLVILQHNLIRLKKRGFLLTYQVTASMPKGFYFIKPSQHFHRRDIVLFKPPEKFLHFLLQKKWLPKNGLMLKYVVGIPGDYVCQNKKWIYINNQKIAPIYQEYKPGKKLPNNCFCGKLKKHQYLLMSTKLKNSFDGRYFGPVNDDRIIGKAKFLLKVGGS
ncbi:MAG: signal peptidase I [Gammaproteobacteria bacterium]